MNVYSTYCSTTYRALRAYIALVQVSSQSGSDSGQSVSGFSSKTAYEPKIRAAMFAMASRKKKVSHPQMQPEHLAELLLLKQFLFLQTVQMEGTILKVTRAPRISPPTIR